MDVAEVTVSSGRFVCGQINFQLQHVLLDFVI